jgi:hypothetical protein
MEEREFLRSLCSTVLSANKNIRFAGVIDETGRLLAGEYRSNIESPLIKQDPESKESSFRASQIAFSAKRQFEPDLGSLNYHLTEYAKAKLLTIALTNKNDRFLCVSMDPAHDCQRVIEAVLENI